MAEVGGQWQLSSRKPYASHLVQRLEISWSHCFCQIQECWGPPATEGGGHRECRQGTGHGRGPQAAAGRGATNSQATKVTGQHQATWLRGAQRSLKRNGRTRYPGDLGAEDGVRQWKARGCFRLSEQEYG